MHLQKQVDDIPVRWKISANHGHDVAADLKDDMIQKQLGDVGG